MGGCAPIRPETAVRQKKGGPKPAFPVRVAAESAAPQAFPVAEETSTETPGPMVEVSVTFFM